MLKAVREVRAS